jgi:hypothetical protein
MAEAANNFEYECWTNGLYMVTVRRHESGWPLGEGQWAQIGISADDGEPRHDWREFQRIKNDVVGEEWEALELYPAESRLLDPSNYYILWACPAIKIGKFKGRIICDEKTAIAPQRGWEEKERFNHT